MGILWLCMTWKKGTIRRSSRFPVCVGTVLFVLILRGAPPWVTAQDAAGDTGSVDIDSLFESGDETTGSGPEADPYDIDDFFAEPDETNDGGDTGAGDDVVDIAALTTSPTEISASVRANLGIGVGLIEWPGSDAAAGRDVDDLMRYSGLYGSGASMSVDARPTSYLRFRTSVGTTLDTDSMNFGSPSISEFFVDYTFSDTVFVRGGKQGLTWGQGRILGNPANLVSRVHEGIAVRGTVPVGRGTTTALLYGRAAWSAARSEISPEAYGYAGQVEQTFGTVSLGLHGHYHIDEDIQGAVTLGWGKNSLNLRTDAVVFWDRKQAFGAASARFQGMGHLFWNTEDEDWIVGTEYQFDSAVRDKEGAYTGHRAGIAIRAPGMSKGGWRPSVSWQHAFQDGSGQVIAAIDGTIAPSLNLSIGIPVIYGKPGTYYRDALAEGAAEDEEDRDDDVIPVDNVVTVLIGFKLSFSI